MSDLEKKSASSSSNSPEDEPQKKWYQSVMIDYVKAKKLRSSKQRDVIAEVFFSGEAHQRIEDVLAAARSVDERISQATVYRTMNLLSDAGLAHRRRFLGDQSLFEPAHRDKLHHDHLICTSCGIIEEFLDDRIEELQDKVAEKLGFILEHHRMELFGRCPKCSS